MRVPVLLVPLLASLALAQGAAPDPCAAGALADALDPSAVQGDARRSPLAGEVVVVAGVVSAAFPGRDGLEGVFVQSVEGDGDPATSDALFVRLAERGPFADLAVAAGDLVAVRGAVLERNELTQLDRLEAFAVCGRAAPPAPATVRLPAPSTAWEALEGMLVAFDAAPVVTEVYDVGRYGELLLADARLFAPSQGDGGGDGAGDNALRSVVLGDASRVENPDPVPYLAPDGTVRVGDRVEGLEAVVVQYGVGAYRLEPVGTPEIVRANPRPEAPPDVGGRLRVASFNVLNYFTTLNERGADTPEELARQTAKLVAALSRLDADVLGLLEIENGAAAPQVLADALNAQVGEDAYAVLPDPEGGTGTDRIRAAVLYRPEAVEPLGSASDPDPVHDRPPLAATFRERATGEAFTLVMVHFKSKGGCPAAGDTDVGFGCWNLRRSAQAEATAAFAERVRDAVGDPDVLVMGDLNSYGAEPPVARFEAAGYRDLAERLDPADRYTYVYFGESGTLDYALADPGLDPQVAGVAVWHINSDEPPALDYNTEYNPPSLYRASPYRSSDHDPVVVGLDLAGRGEE